MNKTNAEMLTNLAKKMADTLYADPKESMRNCMTRLLENENFFPMLMQSDKDPLTFFVVGKKGRCYTNKYSVYEMRLSQDFKHTGYEGVIKSFRLLKDAVKFQLETLNKHNDN